MLSFTIDSLNYFVVINSLPLIFFAIIVYEKPKALDYSLHRHHRKLKPSSMVCKSTFMTICLAAYTVYAYIP